MSLVLALGRCARPPRVEAAGDGGAVSLRKASAAARSHGPRKGLAPSNWACKTQPGLHIISTHNQHNKMIELEPNIIIAAGGLLELTLRLRKSLHNTSHLFSDKLN